MASLSGVSSSNTLSSLMNSANMISGLASGLDTEGMIESLVKSYQTKISQLSQKVTKVEWKQDAYRSIISKMVGFSSKYTSYASSTNLMSAGLFNTAVKVLTKGEYANRVTATGKATSDIQLDAVHQLAKAAQYRTKSNLVTSDAGTVTGKEIDLFTQNPDEQFELSNLSGSLTLSYGSKTVSLSFSEVTDVETMNDIRRQLAQEQGYRDAADVPDADVLAELINRKLADEQIVFNSGGSESADQRIRASAYGNTIAFSERGSGGNGVYISGASGNIAKQLGLDEDDLKNAEEKKLVTLDVSRISDKDGGTKLTRKLNGIEYLAEKSSAGSRTMTMSLDGTTKQVSLPQVEYNEKSGMWALNGYDVSKEEFAQKYTQALQYSVKQAFGDKVTVENKGTDGKLQLEIKARNDGSELIINSAVGDALGIGIISTSYLNTGDKLGDLMGTDGQGGLAGLTAVQDWDFANGKYVDRLDEKGNKLYEFVLNGVTIGNYTKDTSLSTILSDINSNAKAGVQVAYSTVTQSFTFTSKETGSETGITLGKGLASAMFGVDHSGSKVVDILGEDTISREFKFKIGNETFSGRIESNAETMDSLVEKLNKDVLKGSGYTASYSVRDGLTIKDADGETVELDHVGNDNVLRDIMSASKQELVDHTKKKLVDILGEETISGQTFEFTIGEGENAQTFSGSIKQDTGTMQSLLNKLNNEILKGKYRANYYDDRGLVITDSQGKEVKVDYTEDDILDRIVKAVDVQDYSKDKLTEIYGKDIVDDKKLEFNFTIGEGEDAKTFDGKLSSSAATMDDLLKAINNKLPDGYKASYSDKSGRLVIKDKNGKEVKVSYSDDVENNIMRDVMQKVNNQANYTNGQDAKFTVTVNGEQKNMTRSSNSVTLDGMTIGMEDTFNSKEADGGSYGFEVDDASKAVTFQSKTDSDKLIDLIKGMVNDYNIMMSEIKSAYMTMPYQNSNGSFGNYEPLTDEERQGMSESAIERYEEKAKQGVLFGDRTLSALYTKLNQAFSFTNTADVNTLREMGISVSYNVNDGAQAVTIDEDKLRAMLDNDPDRVANLFTKTDGIMDRMKSQLDAYARTTGEPKGILIQQAGSPLSSLSLLNNTWQSEIDNYTNQIARWQDKLTAQVERYTSQFARLEQLISQMNNQSSTLAGLMGMGS